MELMTVIFHAIHVVCALFWFGSLLYTEIVLWPRLRAIGQLEVVQAELRSSKVRKVLAVAIIGTVVFGFLRGAAGGALDRIHTPYGLMFTAAAIIGTSMAVWWLSFPSRELKIGWRLYYCSFWVMLALMFGMRFTA